MNKEIIEGNKLIAEFIGYKPSEDTYYGGMTDANGSNKFPCWIAPDGDKLTHFYFNTSWDWLMPVVEKIEDLDFEVNINYKECSIGKNIDAEHYKGISEGSGESKIQSTYEAIIDFITWYNQQNT